MPNIKNVSLPLPLLTLSLRQQAFPPSGIIFAAVSYLVKSAKNVSSAYDSILKLLDMLKVFITRVNLHARHDILPELRDIFVRKLSCLLVILGLSAKMIREGRARMSMRFHPSSTSLLISDS